MSSCTGRRDGFQIRQGVRKAVARSELYRVSGGAAVQPYDDVKSGYDASNDGDVYDAGDAIQVFDQFASKFVTLGYDDNDNRADEGVYLCTHDGCSHLQTLLSAQHELCASMRGLPVREWHVPDGDRRRGNGQDERQGCKRRQRNGIWPKAYSDGGQLIVQVWIVALAAALAMLPDGEAYAITL